MKWLPGQLACLNCECQRHAASIPAEEDAEADEAEAKGQGKSKAKAAEAKETEKPAEAEESEEPAKEPVAEDDYNAPKEEPTEEVKIANAYDAAAHQLAQCLAQANVQDRLAQAGSPAAALRIIFR